MKFIVYLYIIFLVGCSMNSTTNKINSDNKISNIEFKINKKIGVKIND